MRIYYDKLIYKELILMRYAILQDKGNLTYQSGAINFHHSEAEGWPKFSVDFVGICHSDKTLLADPHVLPVIMGHEIVCHEKANTKTQYYVLCNEISCKKCQYCLDHNFSHCENLIELGVNEHGGYAEFIRAPKEYLIPIHFYNPKIGVLVEPLSCVLHAFHRIQTLLPLLKAKPSKMMIMGCGVIGKIFTHLLLHNSLNIELHLYDIEPAAMRFFENCQDLTLARQLDPESMDMVIECSGAAAALKNCSQVIRKSGIIFLFGLYPPQQNLPLTALEILQKELTISSTLAGSGDKINKSSMMEEAIAYISKHQDFFETLLGKSISLKELATTLVQSNLSASTRIIVEPSL
jgi:L-iditol 2-dehydrogenase